MEKTLLVSIDQGFDFVGFHFREYFDKGRIKGNKQGIFLVTPTKKSITKLKDKIRLIPRLPSQGGNALAWESDQPAPWGWLG